MFTAESSSNGMVLRDFIVGEVPGVLWSPASAPGQAPLVLMSHGGGNQKHPAMAGRAQRPVTSCGFHVAVIDAHDEQEIAELRKAQAAGEPADPIVVRHNAHLAEPTVPDWRATLDALQKLPEIVEDRRTQLRPRQRLSPHLHQRPGHGHGRGSETSVHGGSPGYSAKCPGLPRKEGTHAFEQ